MADEGTTGTATEAPAPEAGQAEVTTPVSNTSDEGQGGSAAPALEAGQAEGASAPKGGEGDPGKAGGEEKAAWDGDTLKWLSSKGHDPAAYDPKNESHSKLIKQTREFEAADTRRRQEEAAKKALEETRRATKMPDTTDEGPKYNYEKQFELDVRQAIRFNGCKNADELYQKNPTVYAELEKEYVVGRQKAWEDHQEWEKEQDREKAEQEKIKAQYFQDFDKAKKVSKEVIDGLKKEYPNLEQNFAKYGVNALTDTLSSKYSVFPEMLFLDDKVAKFFAEASEAIAYRYAESDRKEAWKQEYEKEKLKLAEATGPRPAGTSTRGSGSASGGGSWLETLESHSRPFKT